jgi:NADH-quinone oxidoreductase subunit H
MVQTYVERKVVGRIQDRLGPNRAGPLGVLQPIADVAKLLIKEDIVPAKADRYVFLLAPAVVVASTLLVYAVIPFGRGMVGVDVNIGALYVVAVGSLATVAILMAGWSGRNKFALLGGMRAVAQMLSYEIPMVLALLGPVLLAGSLSLNSIIEAQSGAWFVIAQPIGFLIYLLAGVAESNRAPFDIPEAESELVAGYLVEYSGMKWALFFLGEYITMFTVASMTTILFLGGWRGPFVSALPVLSVFWFLIKVFMVLFVFYWLRGTLPRLRMDQLMALAWKFLLPLALANIMITGLIEKLPLDGALAALAQLVGSVCLGLGTLVVLYLRSRKQRVEGLAAAAE